MARGEDKEIHRADSELGTNMDAAYDRKSAQSKPLVEQCEEEGWITECLPIEVGACGYVGCRLPALLSSYCNNSQQKNKLIEEVRTAAEKASFWL